MQLPMDFSFVSPVLAFKDGFTTYPGSDLKLIYSPIPGFKYPAVIGSATIDDGNEDLNLTGIKAPPYA